jgi:hypothetical protein
MYYIISAIIRDARVAGRIRVPSLIWGLQVVQGVRVVPVLLYRYSMQISLQKAGSPGTTEGGRSDEALATLLCAGNLDIRRHIQHASCCRRVPVTGIARASNTELMDLHPYVLRYHSHNMRRRGDVLQYHSHNMRRRGLDRVAIEPMIVVFDINVKDIEGKRT